MVHLLESLEKALVKLRRKRVSQQLFEKHGGVVQRGPLKGLQLSGQSNVSQGPLALKIFGLYEQEIIAAIVDRGPYKDCVNIGAADGYFSIGLLKAGLVQRSICFEMTQEGRDSIDSNALSNGVSRQIEVFGKADQTIGTHLQQAGFDAHNALVICDIEGGEFELFTPQMFEALSSATIIIELHDRIQTGQANQRQRIVDALPDSMTYELIKTRPAQWSGIDDIEQLSDNDRALAMSEGRKAIGEWYLIYPR